VRSNKLFDADAQVGPRGKPRFYSLCAGQLRRYLASGQTLLFWDV